MSFDVRCTFCRTKLRLDEAPEAGTPIECPKCERTFAAPAVSAPPAASAPAAEPKAKPSQTGKKSRREEPKKREFIHPMKLFAMVGGGMLVLIVTLSVIQFYLNRAGAVIDETLTEVPVEYNYLRGINIKQMNMFPGYASEITKVYKPDVKTAFEELAAASGRDPGSLLVYMVIAARRTTAATVLEQSIEMKESIRDEVYFFATKSPVDKLFARSIPNASVETRHGASYVKLPANNNALLDRAVVYCPTSKLIVLIPAKTSADPVLRGTRHLSSKERMTSVIGSAGRLSLQGHIWRIILAPHDEESRSQSTIAAWTRQMKGSPEGIPQVAESGETSPCISFWFSVGGSGVRVGGAMEVANRDGAKKLLETMQNGPLSKGDESYPPSKLKLVQPLCGAKAFNELLQYLEFASEKNAVYFRSKLSTGENAKQLLPIFNPEEK